MSSKAYFQVLLTSCKQIPVHLELVSKNLVGNNELEFHLKSYSKVVCSSAWWIETLQRPAVKKAPQYYTF